MSGAIPPLPNTPSWHGAQLKHRDGRLSLTCSTHGVDEKGIKILAEKLQRKRSLGRLMRTWEDNIKTKLIKQDMTVRTGFI
jgi:hypothetical protein